MAGLSPWISGLGKGGLKQIRLGLSLFVCLLCLPQNQLGSLPVYAVSDLTSSRTTPHAVSGDRRVSLLFSSSSSSRSLSSSEEGERRGVALQSSPLPPPPSADSDESFYEEEEQEEREEQHLSVSSRSSSFSSSFSRSGRSFASSSSRQLTRCCTKRPRFENVEEREVLKRKSLVLFLLVLCFWLAVGQDRRHEVALKLAPRVQGRQKGGGSEGRDLFPLRALIFPSRDERRSQGGSPQKDGGEEEEEERRRRRSQLSLQDFSTLLLSAFSEVFPLNDETVLDDFLSPSLSLLFLQQTGEDEAPRRRAVASSLALTAGGKEARRLSMRVPRAARRHLSSEGSGSTGSLSLSGGEPSPGRHTTTNHYHRRGSPWLYGVGAVLALFTTLLGYSAYRHGGPMVAMRIHKMQFKKQMPLTWGLFMRSLPEIDESKFVEFEDILSMLSMEGARMIKMVPKVSEGLAEFLNLDEATKKHGIVIKVRGTQGVGVRKLVYEINAHMNIVPKSPFFLPIIGGYRGSSKKAVYLLMPRARSDVAEFVKARPLEVDLCLAAAEMTYALHTLHESGFLHRDIKASNYFVGFDGHAMLADFEGVGVLQQRALIVGTKGYIAPEITHSRDHTTHTDVYALGKTFRKLVRYMRGIRIPRLGELAELIKKMTSPKPSERPSLDEVMKDTYFAGIDFSRLEAKDQGVPFKGNFERSKFGDSHLSVREDWDDPEGGGRGLKEEDRVGF